MLDYSTTPNKTEYQIMPNYTPYKRIDYNASFVEEPKYVLKGTINQQLRDKTSIYLNVRSESVRSQWNVSTYGILLSAHTKVVHVWIKIASFDE